MTEKVKIGRNTEVDIEENKVRLGNKKYWLEEDEDTGEEYWCTGSTRWAEDEEGRRVRIEEGLDLAEEGLNPAAVRVKKPGKTRKLNQLLKKAKARATRLANRRSRSERGGDEGEEEANSSRPKNEDEDVEADDSAVNQDNDEENSRRQTNGLSFRIKSAVSSFSLMFRALPSRKHRGLWNLAVYRDNKLMGYVDVGLGKISDLGKKLQNLE